MIGDRVSSPPTVDRVSEIFFLEGDTRRHLADRARELASALRTQPDTRPVDVSHTLCRRLQGGTARLAIVAQTTADVVERLDIACGLLLDGKASEIADPRGIYFTDEALAGAGRVAFVFPGEGSQYVGMHSDLAAAFPSVGATFEVARAARPTLELYQGNDPEKRRVAETILRTDFEVALHALTTGNIAMWLLAEEFGLRPDVLLGYSSGDYTAALAAEILTIDDIWNHLDSSIWDTYGGVGRDVGERVLLAVGAGAPTALSRLGELSDHVVVAMDNCPHSIVLSGKTDVVEQARERLGRAGLFTATLPGQHAYHTPEFDSYAGALQAVMERVTLRPPSVPIYSCTTADVYPDDADHIRALVLEHWRSPVRFRETTERMYADGVRIFVEVGPNSMLTGFLDDTLRDRPHLAVSMDRPNTDGVDHLNRTLARLFVHGVAFDREQLYAGREARVVELVVPDVGSLGTASVSIPGIPTIPQFGGPDPERDLAVASFLSTMDQFLQTQRSVMEAFINSGFAPPDLPVAPPAQPERRVFPMLGEVKIGPDGLTLSSERLLTTQDAPFLHDHAFGSPASSDPSLLPLPVVPMTFSIETMAEAATALRPDLVVTRVRDIRCLTWLAVPEDGLTLRATAKVLESAPGAATIEVNVSSVMPATESAARRELPAARGVVVLAADYPPAPAAAPFVPAAHRKAKISVGELYDHLFHGPLLQAVTEIGLIGDDGITGALTVLSRDPILADRRARDMVLDAGLLDATQHLVSAWSYELVSTTGLIIPTGVDAVEFYGPPPVPGTRLPFETVIRESGDNLDFDVTLRDSTGQPVIVLRNSHSFRTIIESDRWDRSRHPEDLLFGDIWEGASTPDAENGNDVIVSFDFGGAAGPRSMAEVVYYGFLSRGERRQLQQMSGTAARRVQWLLGRMMAKDAIRAYIRNVHGEWLLPADVDLSPDEHGQLRASGEWAGRIAPPAVSLAHSGEFAAAIAGGVAGVDRRGIDVERIEPRPDGFDRATFTPEELALLDALGQESRDEWMTRMWCAKEAVAKALGRGMVDGPRSVVVVSADPDGRMRARLRGSLALTFPEIAETDLAVMTGIRGTMAYAYTDCCPAT